MDISLFRTGLRYVLLLLLLSLLAGCSRTGHEGEGAVVGKEGVRETALIERSGDMLRRWAEKGTRQAVLVHVSPSSGLGAVPASLLARLKELQAKKDWDAFGREAARNLSDANFLAAAVTLGIVREISWVVPFNLFADPALAEGKVKAFLRTRTSFPAQAVDAMRMQAGCLAGTIAGTNLYVCSPRTLHKIDGPVLLALDGGFAPVSYTENRITCLAALKGLFDELAYREMRIVDAVASYGVTDGTAAAGDRYLVEEFMEGLRTPKHFLAKEPPELWSQRDAADDRLRGGEGRLVLDVVRSALKKYPADRPLRLLEAEALLRTGDTDSAFSRVAALCREERPYCTAYISFAGTLAGRGSRREAQRFYRAGAAALPVDSLPRSREAEKLRTLFGPDSGKGAQ